MTSDYADPTPQADWHKENPSAKADCWQDLRDLERTGNRDRQNHSGMRYASRFGASFSQFGILPRPVQV
jgi:hypothetical protein